MKVPFENLYDIVIPVNVLLEIALHRHVITEILLKVALSTITLTPIKPLIELPNLD